MEIKRFDIYNMNSSEVMVWNSYFSGFYTKWNVTSLYLDKKGEHLVWV